MSHKPFRACVPKWFLFVAFSRLPLPFSHPSLALGQTVPQPPNAPPPTPPPPAPLNDAGGLGAFAGASALFDRLGVRPGERRRGRQNFVEICGPAAELLSLVSERARRIAAALETDESLCRSSSQGLGEQALSETFSDPEMRAILETVLPRNTNRNTRANTSARAADEAVDLHGCYEKQTRLLCYYEKRRDYLPSNSCRGETLPKLLKLLANGCLDDKAVDCRGTATRKQVTSAGLEANALEIWNENLFCGETTSGASVDKGNGKANERVFGEEEQEDCQALARQYNVCVLRAVPDYSVPLDECLTPQWPGYCSSDLQPRPLTDQERGDCENVVVPAIMWTGFGDPETASLLPSTDAAPTPTATATATETVVGTTTTTNTFCAMLGGGYELWLSKRRTDAEAKIHSVLDQQVSLRNLGSHLDEKYWRDVRGTAREVNDLLARIDEHFRRLENAYRRQATLFAWRNNLMENTSENYFARLFSWQSAYGRASAPPRPLPEFLYVNADTLEDFESLLASVDRFVALALASLSQLPSVTTDAQGRVEFQWYATVKSLFQQFVQPSNIYSNINMINMIYMIDMSNDTNGATNSPVQEGFTGSTGSETPLSLTRAALAKSQAGLQYELSSLSRRPSFDEALRFERGEERSPPFFSFFSLFFGQPPRPKLGRILAQDFLEARVRVRSVRVLVEVQLQEFRNALLSWLERYSVLLPETQATGKFFVALDRQLAAQTRQLNQIWPHT